VINNTSSHSFTHSEYLSLTYWWQNILHSFIHSLIQRVSSFVRSLLTITHSPFTERERKSALAHRRAQPPFFLVLGLTAPPPFSLRISRTRS